jgi:uncharacterized protein YfdQ (DUF2303 family)
MADQITNHNHTSEATSIADIVRKHVTPTLLDVSGGAGGASSLGPNGSDEVPVLVLPTGLQAHSVKKYLDEYREAPERRRGTAKLHELASLVDHVNRFKDADSALFAMRDPRSPQLVGVLDYHRRNVRTEVDGATVTASGAPRFGEHRAIYTFPISEEWEAWLEQDGKSMDQAAFAHWLEDRITDVADPNDAFASAKKFADALGVPSFAAPSRLLALSRGLTIHVDQRATAKLDPASGETTVFYAEAHQDEQGAPLAIPRAFLIRIAVFREGEHYQFPVRLQYRHAGGRISWSYKIHDATRAFDHAFREACEEAAERTELPLFFGCPE